MAQEAIQIRTVLSLVESGLGVALVPAMMQQAPGHSVVYRPLADLAQPDLIGIAFAFPPHAHPAVTGLRALASREFAGATA